MEILEKFVNRILAFLLGLGKITASALAPAVFEARKSVEYWVDENEQIMTASEVLEMQDGGKYCVFIWLLSFQFADCGDKLNIIRLQKFCMPKWAYLSCRRVCTLNDKQQNGFFALEDGGRKPI